MVDSAILNERDSRIAKATLERARLSLSPSATIEAARIGISPRVVERHQKAIASLVDDLGNAISNYEAAKAGDYDALLARWRGDPGIALIIARIAKGLSQSALASSLGLKEQQIQRYEADRYQSISLNNYKRFAAALGVDVRASISEASNATFRSQLPNPSYSAESLRRVLSHALDQGWVADTGVAEENEAALLGYIKESVRRLGSPTLLRTGIQALELDADLALSAWRARVIERAESTEITATFDPTDISWLPSLVRLSQNDAIDKIDGLLANHGIILVYEPHFAGLRVDGAALLVDGRPVVAISCRHDRIDNFWFTLMHEIAHVFLHQRMGLSVGFYDDLDASDEDGVEQEADDFASSMLIPEEIWRTSPARISKDPSVIERFAANLGISPAIVFGRIRKERNDYKIFHRNIGAGCVRSKLKQG